MKQRFRVLSSRSTGDLEDQLNRWANTLPPTARIRRTQLTAIPAVSQGVHTHPSEVIALINYEIEDEKKDSK